VLVSVYTFYFGQRQRERNNDVKAPYRQGPSRHFLPHGYGGALGPNFIARAPPQTKRFPSSPFFFDSLCSFVICLSTHYSFFTLSLHFILLTTMAFNPKMVNMYAFVLINWVRLASQSFASSRAFLLNTNFSSFKRPL
jgi:hypothetical protein